MQAAVDQLRADIRAATPAPSRLRALQQGVQRRQDKLQKFAEKVRVLHGEQEGLEGQMAAKLEEVRRQFRARRAELSEQIEEAELQKEQVVEELKDMREQQSELLHGDGDDGGAGLQHFMEDTSAGKARATQIQGFVDVLGWLQMPHLEEFRRVAMQQLQAGAGMGLQTGGLVQEHHSPLRTPVAAAARAPMEPAVHTPVEALQTASRTPVVAAANTPVEAAVHTPV
eukprot:6468672-Amphidinium_carterae.1